MQFQVFDSAVADEDEMEEASIWQIMKMNKPEWWQILVGCATSVVMGAMMPLFAVLFGEIIGVNRTTPKMFQPN